MPAPIYAGRVRYPVIFLPPLREEDPQATPHHCAKRTRT